MRKSVIKSKRTAANAYPAYPAYSEKEDIYRQGHKEDVEPEEISQLRNPKRKLTKKKALSRFHDDDVSDEYLDVPGSELDDDLEEIGSEDEENNYYSLGGDDHENLEEDRDYN